MQLAASAEKNALLAMIEQQCNPTYKAFWVEHKGELIRLLTLFKSFLTLLKASYSRSQISNDLFSQSVDSDWKKK